MTVMSTGGSQRNAHVDGGDASDTIILDGKVYHLTSKPLEGHFQRISWRPAFIRRAPGGPYGYKARWEEFGGRLFLTGLFGMSWIVPPHLAGKLAPDPDPFEPAQDGVKSLRLADLFPETAPLVFAGWVTERLVVPMGPLLFFGHPYFGAFCASHRTVEVVEGHVRSFRDWDALEWAQETDCQWLIDEFRKGSPQVASPREVDAEDKFGDWHQEEDPLLRRLCYEHAQEDALRKPCGHAPVE
jgi:hypothetical protein